MGWSILDFPEVKLRSQRSVPKLRKTVTTKVRVLCQITYIWQCWDAFSTKRRDSRHIKRAEEHEFKVGTCCHHDSFYFQGIFWGS